MSNRNKTIKITDEDKHLLKDKLVTELTDNLLNKTVWRSSLPVLEFMKENAIDFVFFDPPYFLSKNFRGTNYYQKYFSTRVRYKNYINSYITQIHRILKQNGTLYVCGDWRFDLYEVLEEKFIIKNRITWQREKGRGAKTNWKNSHEDIWFCVKDKKNYTFNVEDVKLKRKVLAPYKDNGKAKDWQQKDNEKYRLTYPSNLWDDITVPFWSMSENTNHPTQKPEKLLAKLILASTNKGDTILDPMCGSGTTSVVAKKLGRQYIGIEQNLEYCLLTEKRLQLAEQNKRIQGFEDGVFYERNYKNK